MSMRFPEEFTRYRRWRLSSSTISLGVPPRGIKSPNVAPLCACKLCATTKHTNALSLRQDKDCNQTSIYGIQGNRFAFNYILHGAALPGEHQYWGLSDSGTHVNHSPNKDLMGLCMALAKRPA